LYCRILPHYFPIFTLGGHLLEQRIVKKHNVVKQVELGWVVILFVIVYIVRNADLERSLIVTIQQQHSRHDRAN
jgi:hypothetical protein